MNALILVDLQNDFLPGGALGVPHGDEVLPIANRLQPYFHVVVATQDWHPADHGSFASQHRGRKMGDVIDLDGLPQVLWPDHCVAGSRGAELAPGLHTDSIAHVFPKGTDRRVDSYSGFFDNGGRRDTGLATYLRQRNVTDVYLLGLATDYCVRATALDACKLGFRTWLIEDGCRGVELQAGDCAAAIQEMERAGVRRVHSEQWPGREVPTRETPRRELARGRFLRLMQAGRWEYAERCNARAVVVIVALTADDEYVLIEQFREPLGQRSIELPAGLVGDIPGDEHEELEIAARRELLEETGFEAETVTWIGEASPSAGMTSEVISVFEARGLRRVNEGGGDDGEQIQVHLVPRTQVAQWLARRRAEGLDIALSLYGGLWLAENGSR